MTSSTRDLKGLKVLVTAGPTREYIDPVRFLSNPSTGKMGYEIAVAAQESGADVTLVSGPTVLETPMRIKCIDVISADEMHKETLRVAREADIVIMTAAVADYRPATVKQQKMKKGDQKAIQLHLVRTQDILQTIGDRKRDDQIIVGFAAETNAVLKNARRKLKQKNLDMIVANKVTEGNAFGPTDNQVTVLFADGSTKHLPKMSKERLAKKLIALIAKM